MLTALRSLEGERGLAVSGYLDLVGYRLLDGFDISEPAALELPDALLRAIRGAVAGRVEETSSVEDRIADVRRKVPEQHRSEFDELLGEARLTYRLRDEWRNLQRHLGFGTDAAGCPRGRSRLRDRGRIHDAEHLVDASLGEMCSLLSGSEAPSGDELAKRSEYRASTLPRTRLHFSARLLLRRRTPRGCHRPSPD